MTMSLETKVTFAFMRAATQKQARKLVRKIFEDSIQAGNLFEVSALISTGLVLPKKKHLKQAEAASNPKVAEYIQNRLEHDKAYPHIGKEQRKEAYRHHFGEPPVRSSWR